MSEAVTYVPILIMGMVVVFAVWAMRGKVIPDWLVGILAPIAGIALIFLLSPSVLGVVFGSALIGIGGLAWLRHLRGRSRGGDPDPGT